MNIKHGFLTLMLSMVLALFTLPVNAVSFDRTFSAQQSGTRGTDTQPMRNLQSHFCYLSFINKGENDLGGEWAQCKVSRNTTANVWVLEASLGKSGNSFAFCTATCYIND